MASQEERDWRIARRQDFESILAIIQTTTNSVRIIRVIWMPGRPFSF